MATERFAVRVKANARHPGVGGAWGSDAALIVAVRERAIEGQANDAVVDAVARAFGVPRRNVRIIAGPRSRDKLLEITDAPATTGATMRRLLAR